MAAPSHTPLPIRGTPLLALVAFLAGGVAPIRAASASLQPLVSAGRWNHPQPGSHSHVAVVGNYAYVAGWHDLNVIDVRNPGNPVRVGGYDFGNLWETSGLAVSGGYAYVADDEGGGMAVIDVRNPTNCVRVGGYGTNMEFYGVKVSGNYAYLFGGLGGGVHMIDVRDPTNCVRVGGDGTPRLGGLALSGNYAYATYNTSWEEAYLRVIDVSNPSNWVYVGRFEDEPERDLYFGVAVSGKYAYVTYAARVGLHIYQHGLDVIDVSNPTNPARVGGHATSGGASRVMVSGNYAYIKTHAGLEVIDVRNPTNCVRVGSYEINDLLTDITVVAGRIYVVGERECLLVLPSVPNIQLALRIDATPNVPFTLEAATNLSLTNAWTPLLTTNVPAMPFDFVDFDVKITNKPQKFYRIRQP